MNSEHLNNEKYEEAHKISAAYFYCSLFNVHFFIIHLKKGVLLKESLLSEKSLEFAANNSVLKIYAASAVNNEQ